MESKISQTYFGICSRFSNEELVRLTRDAERYCLDDVPHKNLEARLGLGSYCRYVQSKLEEALKKCREVNESLAGPDHQQIGVDKTKEMKEEMERLLKDIYPSQGSSGGGQ